MEHNSENQLQFTPLRYGHEHCLPGHSYGPKIRLEYSFHYVVSGCGIFKIHGKEYNVVPGELFVIPPREEFYYEADAKTPWSYIWIGFTTNAPLTLDDVIPCCEAKKIFEQIKECEYFQESRNTFLTARLLDLYVVLTNKENYVRKYIDEALEIIHTCYMDELSIKQIAQKLNISHNHLTTLFKVEMNMSPKQYLINYRMEIAANLLSIYKKSIAVVAASVGYPDQFVFSRTFKAHFGASPTQYIQNTQERNRNFTEYTFYNSTKTSTN